MEDTYYANLAMLEFRFPKFLLLQSSKSSAGHRDTLREMWKVGVKQQPCSFYAGKVSAGYEHVVMQAGCCFSADSCC